MIQNKFFKFSLLAAFSLSGSVAMAHLNVAVEDAIAVGDGSREYKEGAGAFLDINISHDCTNEEGSKHFATTGVEVLLPNGASVPFTYTANGNTANAVMGVKQKVNHTFEHNIVKKGEVDPFYSHGVKTEDARVLKWLHGKVDNDHYDNLEMKATFPKIDPESCVAKIKMYFPSIQYCKNGYKMAWINTADSKFGGDPEADIYVGKTKIYSNYAAYATVVRTSDLPDVCGAEGETLEVMPSVEEINRYLGHKMNRRKYRGHDDD